MVDFMPEALKSGVRPISLSQAFAVVCRIWIMIKRRGQDLRRTAQWTLGDLPGRIGPVCSEDLPSSNSHIIT